jgi:hypothetical protein
MNFNEPPEWDAKDVEDCTNCYPQIRRNATESVIKNLDDEDFYSLDDDHVAKLYRMGLDHVEHG